MDYWLITTGPDDEPGINGAITPRMMPEQVTANTISVASVDGFTKKIVDAGGNVMVPKGRFPARGISPTARTQKGTFLASWSSIRPRSKIS
jgi:uncharacterized protein